MPAEPFEPVPEQTTANAHSPCARASERSEEVVDGMMLSGFGTLVRDEGMVLDLERPVRRQHVDRVRLDLAPPLDRTDRQVGPLLQELDQMALLVPRQVQDHHERHGGQVVQAFERLEDREEGGQPSGRSAKGDDWEGGRGRVAHGDEIRE